MTLYLPVAPPGAGKSTLARLMVQAGKLDADAVISPDHYRKLLTGDENDQSENDTVFSMVREIVTCRTLNGLDVYLDATNLKGAVRKLLRKLPDRQNVHVVGIDFSDLDVAEVRRRNTSRDRVVPEKYMDGFIESWNSVCTDYTFWELFDEGLRASTIAIECERILELEAHPVMEMTRGEAAEILVNNLI